MRWVKIATKMSSLVSILFRTFLNPLKFLMEIFNILLVNASHCQFHRGFPVVKKHVHLHHHVAMRPAERVRVVWLGLTVSVKAYLTRQPVKWVNELCRSGQIITEQLYTQTFWGQCLESSCVQSQWMSSDCCVCEHVCAFSGDGSGCLLAIRTVLTGELILWTYT